ncbi:MAG: single-stranded-DNA-specific exonuclease RecJ [Gammaproteobacteria bacterium]|jgi:single-stranded-DNA-specific exonuclease
MKPLIIRTAEPIDAKLQQLELHPILRQVYANRGIKSAKQLETELKNLLPYHQLRDIDKAVMRLYQALQQQQRILVVGDYDVDGATSAALMIKVLREFGAENVEYLIPDRFTHGYGLTPKIVELATQHNPHLIITVDNGIANVEGVNKARQFDIDVIVTDHHLAGSKLPDAVAIINPNQPNDQFSSKNLAGVGVAFYLLLALRAKLREESWFILQNIREPNLADHLDLVALGTVADVVTLDHNNRILVYQGLRRIQAGKCCAGIDALLQFTNCDQANLTTSDLSYLVCPRLNAAGRLEDMSLGVACLLTKNKYDALQMAKQLTSLNNERRSIDKKMQREALTILEDCHLNDKQDLPIGICLLNEKWHQGVVGVLASRVKERLYRPVIVFTLDEKEQLKGSARSIPGLHIREVLDEIALNHPELLVKFGGHAQAAGVTIEPCNFTKFSQVFDQTVHKYLSSENLQYKLISDGELGVDDFSMELAQLLSASAPWGCGFDEPLFDNKFRVLEQRIVGGSHLKLRLEFNSRYIDAIAFNIDTKAWPNADCQYIHAAYRLRINEYLGDYKLQLLVQHLEPV